MLRTTSIWWSGAFDWPKAGSQASLAPSRGWPTIGKRIEANVCGKTACQPNAVVRVAVDVAGPSRQDRPRGGKAPTSVVDFERL